MEHPPEPLQEDCSNNTPSLWQGLNAIAIWYPQMGGYVGKCVAVKQSDGCIDCYIWHDGIFPFNSEGDDEPHEPKMIHHCMAEQFIDFGRTLEEKLLKEN